MTLEPHLLDEDETGWAFWRWIYVRGAGFPANWVVELADSPTAACVDERTASGAVVARERERAIAAVRTARQQASDWKPFDRALRMLQREEPVDALPELASVLVGYHEAIAARVALEGKLAASFDDGQRRIRERLASIVVEPRFREAVTWQNRGVLPGLDSLLHGGDHIASKRRKNERLAASYVQRYCVKNDTIGFFGPAGWGRFGDTTRVAPGAQLLATRTVHFEYWAIDAVARTLASWPELRPWLVPRRSPWVHLDGTTLLHSGGVASELPPDYAAALAACTGDRTAREIYREVRASLDDGATEADLFGLLEELVEQRALVWTLEVSTHAIRPERELRDRLAVIDERELRESALGRLARLEVERDAVAAAAGNATKLAAAMEQLGTVFGELTGEADTRLGGVTYAGRTLVFETCRRDLDVQIDPAILANVRRPLTPILRSARWFTFEIARRYRAALEGAYRELAGDAAEVDFQRFWKHIQPLFPGPDTPSIAAQVGDELVAKWEQLLGLDAAGAPDRAHLEFTTADVDERAAAVFAASHPGWPTARHHSPDVLIAARGVDALARGEYLLVLGEVHVAINSLTLPVATLAAADDPSVEQLIAGRERDLSGVGIAPVWSKRRVHTDYYSLSRHDLDLEIADSRSPRPRSQVVTPGALVAREHDGRVVIATRDGTRTFDLIAFFEHYLVAETYSRFSITGRAPHTPRLVIDRLVVSRERWTFLPDELPRTTDPLGVDSWSAMRAWARAIGLPRLVFVKVPEETKPLYVDFDSPLYIDVLLRQVKRASRVTITEMLPAIDQTWLVDAGGHHYTSELRLTARDPEPWRP